MYTNINAGLGSIAAHAMVTQALSENPGLGHFVFVGASTTPSLSEFKGSFPEAYPDGTRMFYTTIDDAVNSCVASRVDRILVLPGHTESLASATALVMDTAGVQVVGLGKGNNIPTVTLSTVATTKVPVSAANVVFKNIRFVAAFADIATVFLLTTAPGFVITDCEFADTSSILNFLSIITTTVSVSSDNITFKNNKVYGLGTTAATTPIKVLGTLDRLTITGNTINLAALSNTSAVLAHGALVVTNLDMGGNRVLRPSTDTATGALLVTTSSTTNTGMVYNNYVGHADAAGALLVTAGSVYTMVNNLAVGDADASAFVLPAIGTN